MNFSNLDGYMFEDLIALLFKKMGFSVEQTALSGDGGIDIIAYNTLPVYKGKYLIQCKNWNNVVGQPEVRDLYGVVMSEQANKGILITTSHFTEQAMKFADNKNIELIGHDVLIKLLDEYGLLGNEKDNKTIKIHFTDFHEFDKAKYTYLKSKVENNRTEKLYYDNLKQFYRQYIISNNYAINKNGLIDEYINLNNESIKRFCKKSKEKIAEGDACKYINGYLYILKGELFNAIEIYRDLGLLKENSDINSYKIDNISSERVILKNLYLLFAKLGYCIGMEYLENLLTKSYKVINRSNRNCYWPGMGTNYFELRDLTFKEIEDVFKNIKSNVYNRFHIPINVYSDKVEANYYELYVDYEEQRYIPIEDLIDVYYKDLNDKITSELEKSKILLT